MKLLRSIAMAFSMFSRLPMPNLDWREENMSYAIAALPAVGLVVWLALWLWMMLAGLAHMGATLCAAGLVLTPLAVTGGVHLDGFADMVDALASHAPPEKKRQILKDPNAGAFAVIAIGAYFLLYFALASELIAGWEKHFLYAIGLLQVSSRSLGALSVLALPSAKGGGILDAFKDASKKGALLWLFLLCALCGAGWLLLNPWAGGAAVLAGLVAFVLLARTAKKQFGGMSGDLAGFLIQVSEVAMLAAFVLVENNIGVGLPPG